MEFFKDTIHQRGKWTGRELLTLHRFFPCDVIEMFQIWYSSKYCYLDESCDSDVEILVDEYDFVHYFGEELLKAGFTWKEPESKSEYNRSQGEYKYLLSSLRLTRVGIEIYAKLLPYNSTFPVDDAHTPY
jgi:hypothetical protein